MSAGLHWYLTSAGLEKQILERIANQNFHDVQGEKLTGDYLVKWYHRLMNTATAQANPNIALAMVSQGNTVYDDYEAGFAWCEDMFQKQP